MTNSLRFLPILTFAITGQQSKDDVISFGEMKMNSESCFSWVYEGTYTAPYPRNNLFRLVSLKTQEQQQQP